MSLKSISELQNQIQVVLGPNYAIYLENMTDWFGQRITKDFFDEKMARILKNGALEIHNELMRLIIFYCASTPTISTSSALSNDITMATAVNSTNNNYITTQEPYENSPIVYEQIQIQVDGSLQEPEYITMNFVDNEETISYDEVDEPIEDIPADWLFNVNVVRSNLEDSKNIPFCTSNEKFPSNFSSCFQRLQVQPDASKDPDALMNITHGYDISDRLNKNSQLKQHFKLPSKENQTYYMSTGCTLHGRFLLKAWELGLDGVDHQAFNLLLEGVRKHIKILVTAVIKQRRAFRMRNKQLHSIGVPYPNPYLRQGQQLFDDPYSSDSTKLADVMQVPTLLPPMEEKERIASLQLAASIPTKDCRFPAFRATLADVLDVIENDPAIIPQNNSRLKLLAIIKQNYKGYGGMVHNDNEEEDDTQGLLPICSY